MFTDWKEWTSELTSDTFPQQSVSANKLLCRRYPLILLMPWSLAHCILTFYRSPLPSFLSLRACHYQSVSYYKKLHKKSPFCSEFFRDGGWVEGFECLTFPIKRKKYGYASLTNYRFVRRKHNYFILTGF